ncbi:TIGR02147 family protein [Peredibacter sp. HCB2-198]|uniref:TIGR02147 family protein n=1 Tax=Peredibacter sp. HCB2-198 TaxID=3383025 RepID=UPI0038B5531C
MMENDNSLAILLSNILEARKKKNANYSLRAFARDLGISSGRLSNILNNKYLPGTSISNRIIASLNLNEKECEEFNQILEECHKKFKLLGEAHLLHEEEYALIRDWHHFAILNLMETSTYVDDPNWIAGRLNLTVETVIESLDILEDLNLIEMKKGKRYPTYKNLTTTHGIPSEVVRESHRQIITKSLDSLNDPNDIRDITSVSVSVNMANLPKVKELAREFRRKAALLLEEGERTEVYNINIQIVPVTKNIMKNV